MGERELGPSEGGPAFLGGREGAPCFRYSKETRRNYQQSEESKEAHRKYNQSEKGKAAKAQKVECGCGAKVSSNNMARHRGQAKHKRWLEEAERVGPALSERGC